MSDENWLSLSRGLGAKVVIIHGQGIRISAYRKLGNHWSRGNSRLFTIQELKEILKNE